MEGLFGTDCRNLVYELEFHGKAIFISQRLKTLNWAKTHVNWTAQQWYIVWSDETKISLFRSDGIKYVRRRIGDLHPDCIILTVKHPLSVMVWIYMISKVPAEFAY